MRMRLKTAASAIAISTAILAQNASAQTERMRFEIEAKPVSQALQDFAVQSGYQMAFLANAAAGARARSVSGTLSPEEALQRLLEGTGLEFRLVDERTIAILQKTAGADSEGRSGETSLQYASANEEVQQSAALQEIAQAQTQTAQAQTQTAADASSEIEEIVVTGSRLRRSGTTTPTPVTMLDAETLSLNAETRLADTLNQLPALGATQTPSNTNFNPQEAGTNFLDLRRMGIDRTLVLINGRRQVASRPGSGAVDTNTIPTAMVERVEVITGGASAVYGADAVSGIVNIILKDSFEGLEFDGQVGTAGEGDGESYKISITGGLNFDEDRGNVYVNGTFDKNERIVGINRGFSNKRIRFAPNPENTGPNDGIPDQVLFEGTGFVSTPRSGRVVHPDGFSLFEAQGGPFTFDENGNLVPQELGQLPASFLTIGGQDAGNLSRFDLNLAPVERLLISGGIRYRLHEKVNFFADAKFANIQAETAGQSTFTLPGFEPVFIQADNPFVPQELQDILAAENLDGFFVSRTNDDLGQDSSKSDRDTVQLYVGFEGTLTPNLDYTVHYQFGRSDNTTELRNVQIPSRFQQQLDAVRDPDTGEIVCRDPSNGCVPLNLLGANRSLPEARDFSFTEITTFGEIEESVVNATLTGDTAGLFEPFVGPVSFATGFEYRKEEARTEEGFLRNTGDIFGSPPILDTEGDFDVWELFAEVRVPLLRDLPLVQELNVEAAARFGDYSTIEETVAWKVGGDWAVTEDLRFRGIFSKAVRAPNIGELFAPGTVQFAFLEDPCDADNLGSGSPNRRMNCAALGLPPDFQSQSLNRNTPVIGGGNPDLKEEKADSKTIGVVITPRWLPGFSFTLDYWDIEIKDAINAFPAQSIVNNCVDASSIDNPFCTAIERFPNGDFETIQATLLNVAAFEASGIDFEGSYFLDLSSATNDFLPGTVDFSFVATYLDQLSFFGESDRSTPDREAGELGDPDFNMVTRATYKLGAFIFSLEERFISSQKFDLGESEEARSPNTTDSEWYTDINLRYDLTNDATVFVGVDNLFDNAPPRLARIPEIRSFTGDSTVFDQIGRFIRVGATVSF